jgi:hypothetical protein
MDKNNAGFVYLKNTFPGISDAKIKEGVFVGPQIRELIKGKFHPRTGHEDPDWE